ncbi:MAG: hypothetical protein J6C97_01130 [Clostridia bacterium]|nr:hypothetical protein [Clostridia bacterium]
MLCNFFICTNITSSVYAEEVSNIELTSVLEDLERDSTFNKDDYKENLEDTSISLITIAENTLDELYVYTFQPNPNTLCSSLNLQYGDNSFTSVINNYKLLLISSDGVFFKYKVKIDKISNADTYYYDIISIYRFFDANLDGETGNQIITEKSYSVGRKFYVNNVGSNKYYSYQDIKVVEIKDKICGTLRYFEDYSVDAWTFLLTAGLIIESNVSFIDTCYIAFNTDVVIEDLLEVEVVFNTQNYVYACDTLSGHNGSIKWDNNIKEQRKVVVPEKKRNHSKKWFLETFSWNTIQTGKEFVAGFNNRKFMDFEFLPFTQAYEIDAEGKAKLENKQFVVHFYDFKGVTRHNLFRTECLQENITDVSVLRLKYQTNGELFDLGAVDTKQSGKGTEGLGTKAKVDKKVVSIIVIIVVIALIVVLAIYCPWFLKLISAIFTYIGKGIVWVFNGIVTLFKKIFKKE